MHVVCVWCTCVHAQSTSALPPEMGGAACSMAHTWRHKKHKMLLHKTNTITKNKHKMLLHKTNTITQNKHKMLLHKTNTKCYYTKQTQLHKTNTNVITTCNMLTCMTVMFCALLPPHFSPAGQLTSLAVKWQRVFLMGGCVAVRLVVLAAIVQLPSSKETIQL